MKHFGDITKLHGGDLPPVDVICGGSPCQDLSVAGKRAGMKNAINGDEETTRSGLFYDQIRIIKEMRNSYESGTDEFVRPGRYSIWENVPGAFSSNGGRDFQAVLTEFIRIVEPDAPDVPLPDKGKWPKAGCLYDEMGRWSLAWRLHDLQYWGCPQRRKRVCVLCDFDGPTAPWILFDPQFRREAETAPTEQAESDPGDEPRPEVQPVGESLCGDSVEGCAPGEGTAACAEDGAGSASYTLKVMGGGQAGQGYPCVLAVDMYNQAVDGDVSKTLNSRATDSDHTPCVMAVDVYNQTEDGEIAASLTQVSPTLTSNNAGGNQRMPDKDNFNAVLAEPAGVECMQNGFYQATGDQAPSLLSRDYKDPPVVKKPQSVVRRLTPTECERLQGFPDGWTDIGEWTDSKGKTHKDADSPRYKALGNSIGLPFWQWLAERICSQYPPDHQVTLGSLFDGIGGFPLVFERCGGKAVWASEIEEFPIAVTKKHFPEDVP